MNSKKIMKNPPTFCRSLPILRRLFSCSAASPAFTTWPDWMSRCSVGKSPSDRSVSRLSRWFAFSLRSKVRRKHAIIVIQCYSLIHFVKCFGSILEGEDSFVIKIWAKQRKTYLYMVCLHSCLAVHFDSRDRGAFHCCSAQLSRHLRQFFGLAQLTMRPSSLTAQSRKENLL